MKREQVVGLFLLGLSAAVSGCATTTAPSRRVFVSDAHVKVVVSGGGRVTGGPIACASSGGPSTDPSTDPSGGPSGGPSDGNACTGSVEDLWSTELLATPAPGWRFAGFTRSVERGRLSPTPGFDGEVVVHTAVFERQVASAAVPRAR